VSALHVVLPGDIDDPATPSGGNRYDREVCRALAAAGWSVHEHAVAGTWPRPAATHRRDLGTVLSSVPDGSAVLVDGLIASAVPEVLAPHADRLRVVVLVHLPLDDDTERAALARATAVVTTSGWTRDRLLDRYGLPAGRVHVAVPGVTPAPLTVASAAGTRLLCVAAVTPVKGHDLLMDALATVGDRAWRCVCVGSLDRDPDFAARVRRDAPPGVSFTGPLVGTALDAAYADADLLVLPSRGETYGMVLTEALARGVPVLARDTNGVPEAVGRAGDGTVPGLLVGPGGGGPGGGGPDELAAALRRWLTEPDLRERLRRSARARRDTLPTWASTADTIANVLNGVRV
jgi:glycosyltransferase involved in cell wall biosynthesis